MSEDPEQVQPAGESQQKRAARRWRDDPLSVFLAVAAVLLGVMYALEQSDVSTVEEAAARAHALGASSLDMEGCTVGSASTDGTTLVVACPKTAADTATLAAARSPDLSGFERVLFVGADVQLECPLVPADWPAGCEQRSKPTPQITPSPTR